MPPAPTPGSDPPPAPPPPPPRSPAPPLPYPTSLCHACAAPPRVVRTRTSAFLLCPWLPPERKYPPQPVRSCALFRPRA